MKNLILYIFILTFSTFCFAETYSMRSCMLLPITDTAGNSLGYKVFEQLEEDIKERGWCDYKPSSEIIGIFSKYRERLPEYLKDEGVLKTVAERLRVGTIVRVSLEYEIDQIRIQMDIIGENGSDIYMSEKTLLNSVDVDLVVSTVRNWLELYEDSIPYDGKVVGVLGDQVTFTIPPARRLLLGQELSIKRFIRKKQHPLLKKIVEWDSSLLAKTNVSSLSKGQGLATVKLYTSKKKLSPGDWVTFEKPTRDNRFSDKKIKEFENNRFGKLGELSVALGLTSHKVATSSRNGGIKGSGPLFGVHVEGEAWVTRNYFAMGAFSRSFGNLGVEGGAADQDSSGQTTGAFRIGGGYKYLPLGFFYGPQINFYGGWAHYSYELDESSDDGFGSSSFSGIFLGVGGSLPVKRQLRLLGSIEIMPFGEFGDDSDIFGRQKSFSSFNLKLGAHYQYTPTVKVLIMINALNNSAQTRGDNSKISFRDNSLRLGGVFSF